jgi:hypothetical protein
MGQEVSQMEQWEYRSVTIQRQSPFPTAKGIAQAQEQLMATVNEWGEQGWELAQVISRVEVGRDTGDYFVILKRRKS